MLDRVESAMHECLLQSRGLHGGLYRPIRALRCPPRPVNPGTAPVRSPCEPWNLPGWP